MPVVRPRTAMLHMRKMLLSDHASGKAWEAAYGEVPDKGVIPAVLRPIPARREVVERRAESPLSPMNQRRKPGAYRSCWGDEDLIGEGTVNLTQTEQEMAGELDRGGMTPLRAKTWAAGQRGSPLPRSSSSLSEFVIPASYEVLLNEKDMQEERLFRMWSSGRSDRPRSPIGRPFTAEEADARAKLLLGRTVSSPSDATYLAKEWLVPEGPDKLERDNIFADVDRDTGHESVFRFGVQRRAMNLSVCILMSRPCDLSVVAARSCGGLPPCSRRGPSFALPSPVARQAPSWPVSLCPT